MGVVTLAIGFAGAPPTNRNLGISRVTTEEAATTDASPIVNVRPPGAAITQFAHIKAFD